MITIVIATWQTPFPQVVRGIHTFDVEADAVRFINEASRKWWDENQGARCLKEMPNTDPYHSVEELGYDLTHWQLWGGETAFTAMLDHDTAARLHEAHYKREFDNQGLERPGYLQVAYAQGHQPK